MGKNPPLHDQLNARCLGIRDDSKDWPRTDAGPVEGRDSCPKVMEGAFSSIPWLPSRSHDELTLRKFHEAHENTSVRPPAPKVKIWEFLKWGVL